MRRTFILTIFSSLILLSCSVDETRQNTAVKEVPAVSPDALSGQLLVRFDASVSDILEKNGLTKSGPSVPMRRSGLPDVDEILDLIDGYEIERVFPVDVRTENAARRSGLHLWYVVRFSEEHSVQTVAQNLSRLGEVSHVEYNRVLKRASDKKPQPLTPGIVRSLTASAGHASFDDKLFPLQWHIVNKGNLNKEDAQIRKFVEGSDVQVEKAWELCKGHPSIIVAVLDEGVDYSHPDLAANMWVNEDEEFRSKEDNDGNGYAGDYHGYNFVQNSGVITTDTRYDVGHGSHVAGVIAAVNNNGKGISSIAGGDYAAGQEGVKIMSCQIFSGNMVGSVLDEVRAIKYAADNGAVILQCSWGYISGAANMYEWGQQFSTDDEWKDNNLLESKALDYFIHNAGSPDGVIDGGVAVFAAGNEYAPAAGYPGAYPDFVSVAAFAGDFTPAVYSNYGGGTKICAPGGDQDYYYEYGEGVEMGMKGCVLSTLPLHLTEAGSEFEGYGYMEGTSMACPHVSGVLALGMSYAAQLRKHFKAEEIKELLYSTALPIEKHWESGASKFYYKYVADMGQIHPTSINLDDYRNKMGHGQANAYGLLKAIEGAGADMTFPNQTLAEGELRVISPAMYFKDGENQTYEVSVGDESVATAIVVRSKVYIGGHKSGQTEAVIRTVGGAGNRFVITVRPDTADKGWL